MPYGSAREGVGLTSASVAERTIVALFARDVQSIAADERSNSLIVRGAADELNLIYHIVTRLDELSQQQQTVRRVIALDLEFDFGADRRRAFRELHDRHHALAAAAGDIDEHVRVVDAHDAPLLHRRRI